MAAVSDTKALAKLPAPIPLCARHGSTRPRCPAQWEVVDSGAGRKPLAHAEKCHLPSQSGPYRGSQVLPAQLCPEAAHPAPGWGDLEALHRKQQVQVSARKEAVSARLLLDGLSWATWLLGTCASGDRSPILPG